MHGPKILYVSGSIGLGHAARDLAIARELRGLNPAISWNAATGAVTIVAT